MRDCEATLLTRLNHLISVGIALGQERDHYVLLERILTEAKALTQADAGTLYSVHQDKSLRFEMVQNNTLGMRWNRHEDAVDSLQEIPLFDAEGKPYEQTIASYCALKQHAVNIPDVYREHSFDFSGTRDFDKKTGYRSVSFLAVPLRDMEGQTIGVLQLINALDPKTGEPRPFGFSDQHLVESLASMAAVAMNNRRLLDGMQLMLESFIEALADAIDAKSAHTGEHCRRVPILAEALAEAVNRTNEGPLEHVHLSEQELYELKVASLLHDCGKIVTPAHVIDKSTRLQTVGDAIDIIRLRFSLREKELELAAYRGQLTEAEALQEIAALCEALDFIETCNQYDTIVTADMAARLEEIARLTLSNGAALLESHELENLSIPRGTLNSDERQVIENHVSVTQDILGKLIYPPSLREVPEIAGNHHERCDGSGYPHGLAGSELSLRARLLALADLFEALTASDRPYKDPLPLSEALAILRQETEEGRIDADLYEVFVKQQVYKDYARRHMSDGQIDV